MTRAPHRAGPFAFCRVTAHRRGSSAIRMGRSSSVSRTCRALALCALIAVAALALAAPRVASAQKKRTSAVAMRGIAVRGTVTGADIVRAARDYLGVRYVWCGDTPRAFDCSGFTRYVFAR